MIEDGGFEFVMYLASNLGHPSPTRMLEEMSPTDLALWGRYMELYPFGEAREDARHGIRSALFVQANSKKGTKVKPSDFYPKFRESKKRSKPMSVEKMLNFAQLVTSFFGGEDKRPKP